MSYHIHITKAAERDINYGADHIEFVLKNPKAVDDFLDQTEKRINSLADFPERYQVIDDPVLASWEIRYIVVNNYLAFYVIDRKKKAVIIVRFLYQKSNWNAIAHHGISLI